MIQQKFSYSKRNYVAKIDPRKQLSSADEINTDGLSMLVLVVYRTYLETNFETFLIDSR